MSKKKDLGDYVTETKVIHTTSGVHKDELTLVFPDTLQPRYRISMKKFRKWCSDISRKSV